MADVLFACGKITAMQSEVERLLLAAGNLSVDAVESAHQQLTTAQGDLYRHALCKPLAALQQVTSDRSHSQINKIKVELDRALCQTLSARGLTLVLNTSYELDASLAYAFVRYPFADTGSIHVLLLSDQVVRLACVENPTSTDTKELAHASLQAPSLARVCQGVQQVLAAAGL
jgi:hypothetical protein